MNRILFLLLVLTLIAGCTSQKNDDPDRPAELIFDVDSELLGEQVHLEDQGVRFNPPREWGHISGDVFDEAIQQLENNQLDHEPFSIQPIRMFLHPQNGSTLIVSEITTTKLLPGTGEIMKAFRTVLKERFNDTDVLETIFLKDEIQFHQYLVQSQDKVNFKFLFTNTADDLLQVDYIVPRSVYLSESKAIESSIGSIHPLTK